MLCMFVLFEEAGKYQGGRILSETDASAQIELDSGKRVKTKSAQILLRFAAPPPAELIGQARALANGIDLDLAWESAADDEFGFTELAADYFGNAASQPEQAAALFALFEAPHYFRRAGKGRFRKAPAEIVQQALAAIEKKQAAQAQIDAWAEQLAAGECPVPVRERLYKILFKPDKNAPEYRAVVEAARATQRPPLELLRYAGAIESPYQFHWQRFLFENFPDGTAFPATQAPTVADGLPQANVQTFSIDDSQTTEIDDALSVDGLGSGNVTVGIHIAAPGLAFAPGGAMDQVARQRLSTVYMPGQKITMLPAEVVAAYTLAAGRDCPAVSLYARFDEASLALLGSETRVERVHVAANLRHDQLDGIVTPDWLMPPADVGHAGADAPPRVAPDAVQGAVTDPLPALRPALVFLYRLARHLKAQREIVRGKPENFNRPDYTFRLEGVGADGVPTGREPVAIGTRQRGAPLDLIVAEAMILANSTWGSWLGDLGVPALYRSQASLAPGVKVRMGTRPAPHAGIGVRSYAWSTSPLRRYVDLVNQWQIIAAARHGQTAALAAPFKPKGAELFAIVSAFEATYSAYNANQAVMERFWTLQYLRQQQIDTLDASVIKELGNAALLRADTLPLVFAVATTLPRGARVRVRLGTIDEIALEVDASVIERLDSDAAPTRTGDAGESENGDDDDDAATSGPLTLGIAIDEDDVSAAVNSAASSERPSESHPA